MFNNLQDGFPYTFGSENDILAVYEAKYAKN